MKTNALRSKSRTKRKEIETENNNIDGLQEKLKANVNMDCFVFKGQ